MKLQNRGLDSLLKKYFPLLIFMKLQNRSLNSLSKKYFPLLIFINIKTICPTLGFAIVFCFFPTVLDKSLVHACVDRVEYWTVFIG